MKLLYKIGTQVEHKNYDYPVNITTIKIDERNKVWYYLDEDDSTGYEESSLKPIKSRFIDRKELKDKINNEFELHRTIFKHKAIFTEKGFNNLKKKILELVK